jgi:hypothetical protein
MSNGAYYPFFKAWENHLPLVGGLIYTYRPGTDDKATTYSDTAMTIPNTNPVVLNSYGEAPIFFSGTIKMVCKDAEGNELWTMDGVSSDKFWSFRVMYYGCPKAIFGNVFFGELVIP